MISENREIIKRLDTMIALLAENMGASGIVGRGRIIEILKMGGLGPTEIGKIVGLPTTSIGSILSKQKKQKIRKKSKQ